MGTPTWGDLSIEEMWDQLLGKLNQVESVVPKIPFTGDSRHKEKSLETV